MNWRGFAAQAQELAGLGDKLFDKNGMALVGTLRRNGWPRISPVETYVVDGELMLGMMWRSRKALDLLADPRLVVHSATSDREGTEGDFKLYGVAVDIADPELRTHYGDATEARIEWRPTGPFHLFSVDISSAAYIEFGAGRRALLWTEGAGLERMRHPDD